MAYLMQRGSRFYFNRRIPKHIKPFIPGRWVRFPLKTDSRKAALELAVLHNKELEAYWTKLLETDQNDPHKIYEALVQRAQLLGYSYHYTPIVANLPILQLIERVLHVDKNDYQKTHVDAVLGAEPKPKIRLSDALDKYWDLAKDKTLKKTTPQLRKWKNPRKRAMKRFIARIGDKLINELTRDDTLLFRDWQIERVKKNEIKPVSANKDMIHVKTIVSTVSDNFRLGLDKGLVFGNLLLKKGKPNKRLAFTTDHIINVLLKPENLTGLTDQERYALYAFAETGAGMAELTSLNGQRIILNHQIPHIRLIPEENREMKNEFRERIIPIVGYALEAFKACPRGFTDYFENPDLITNKLNSYLRESGLFPSKQHSVYSLRHSFQNRLLAVNAPDRVQADLMGHKFNRPVYGDGPSLMQKLEWLDKIRL